MTPLQNLQIKATCVDVCLDDPWVTKCEEVMPKRFESDEEDDSKSKKKSQLKKKVSFIEDEYRGRVSKDLNARRKN